MGFQWVRTHEDSNCLPGFEPESSRFKAGTPLRQSCRRRGNGVGSASLTRSLFSCSFFGTSRGVKGTELSSLISDPPGQRAGRASVAGHRGPRRPGPPGSKPAPPSRIVAGKLEFLGIPDWLAFAVIGRVFILMMKNAYC